MSQTKKNITIYTLCTILGAAAGTLGTTIKATLAARAYAREAVTEIALQTVDPVREELHEHLARVASASALMLDHKAQQEQRWERQDGRDSYIVESIAAVCRASRASCPSPAKLVGKGH